MSRLEFDTETMRQAQNLTTRVLNALDTSKNQPGVTAGALAPPGKDPASAVVTAVHQEMAQKYQETLNSAPEVLSEVADSLGIKADAFDQIRDEALWNLNNLPK